MSLLLFSVDNVLRRTLYPHFQVLRNSFKKPFSRLLWCPRYMWGNSAVLCVSKWTILTHRFIREKNADFFIMPRLSAFIIFSLSFVRGQWSVTTSELFKSSSRLTAGVPSVIFWGERVKLMTFMPNALAISATFFPMSP